MKPSQLIKSTEIDDAYDALHGKLEIANKALREIANSPFDIDGYDDAATAAARMNGIAEIALSESV